MRHTTPERLNCSLGEDGSLRSVGLPEADLALLPSGIEPACCLWTSPLMARHPVLREDGITLDAHGRVQAGGEGPGPRFIGSGAAVPAAVLGGTGRADPALLVDAPVCPGSEESEKLSVALAVAGVTGEEAARGGCLCAHSARGAGIRLRRAGFSLHGARLKNLDAEYAILCAGAAPASVVPGANGFGASGLADKALILCLVGDKRTRTLLGAQVMGFGPGNFDAVDGLFNSALGALAEGATVDALAVRGYAGQPGNLLCGASAILRNKFDTPVKGVSPDELVASKEAGAEFFLLDLRSKADWQQEHLVDSYNIPLPELKKRLQDEVPRYTPLVLASRSGRDAYVAASRLAGLGASDLYVLDGGILLWPFELSGIRADHGQMA